MSAGKHKAGTAWPFSDLGLSNAAPLTHTELTQILVRLTLPSSDGQLDPCVLIPPRVVEPESDPLICRDSLRVSVLSEALAVHPAFSAAVCVNRGAAIGNERCVCAPYCSAGRWFATVVVHGGGLRSTKWLEPMFDRARFVDRPAVHRCPRR